jgi:hypothetical protein
MGLLGEMPASDGILPDMLNTLKPAEITAWEVKQHCGCLRWTVIRHPAARLVSCWHNRIHDQSKLETSGGPILRQFTGMSFSDFVTAVCAQADVREMDEHYAPQVEMLTVEGEPIVDEIYRLETLEAEWPRLQERFGLPELPHLNRSEHEPWTNYYDAKLRRLVEWRFGAVFHVGGYSWEQGSC